MSLTGAASWEQDVYVPYGEEELRRPSPVNNKEVKKELSTFKDFLYDFLENTTLHGYAYIVQPTPFYARKVLWALYIVCSSLFFVYYTSSQLEQFLHFQKNNLIEVQFKNSVRFPAVTICNQNPFKFTSSVDAGWYETAFFIANANVNETIKKRNCTSDEVGCLEDNSCINIDQLCDGFPDCLNGSDEAACERCPLIFLETTGSNSTDAFNRQYVYYGKAQNDEREVYIARDHPFVYLYQVDDVWYLTDGLQKNAVVYAMVRHSAGVAEKLGTGIWLVNTSAEWKKVVVDVKCDLNYWWLLDNSSHKIEKQLNMEILYNKTAHRLEDMLRRCRWKGDSCTEVGNITTTMTDLGLCYTLSFDESTIEHAGAGYGLSMIINTEQYEYVKSTKKGVGIKLLLHEINEIPKMEDNALAVSPGVVSFIAMESTKVDNLPEPWGNCGETPLQYYDDYSESRCLLECETRLLEDECGCRVVYMPHKEGNPEVCDVETYEACAVPYLSHIRSNSHGNYCVECIEPCHRNVYVTTTSFALMMANLGDDQDLRRYTLSRSLFTAREFRYRHIHKTYKRTMKQFHNMDRQVARLQKLLDILKWQISKDYDDITTYTMLVNEDCKMSRNMLKRASLVINTEMLKPLEDFKTKLFAVLVKYFPSLDQLTSDLIKMIEDFRTEYDLRTNALILDFGTCEADCKTTLEGFGYSGNISTTISGYTCQRWDKQSPHEHYYKEKLDKRFPEGNIVEAGNHCRNPDKHPAGPWCYTIDPDVERETCLVPICSDCRDAGQPYRGDRQLTLRGYTCQKWASQSPHPHHYSDPAYFPDDSLTEADNFCRNPDNKDTGPWCYTTDPDVTWETCAIPLCHDCKMKSLGTDYVGTKAVTRTGRPCQRWDMQYPHKHIFTDASRFPDRTLADASNFCRNPDFKEVGPWCFTTDPTRVWEPCGIPFCSKCKDNDDVDGIHYDGTQSVTIFGHTCQRWDSQSPHRHNYTNDSMFPNKSVEAASNYCRNPDPDQHSAPWCYTTDPEIEWEPCDISLCNDCFHRRKSTAYNGNRAVTVNNRRCQRWDSQYPHKHHFNNATGFPDRSLFEANNYCRNPDSRKEGPWCYTTDPDVEMEFCGIPECPNCRNDQVGATYKGTQKRTKSGIKCQRWDSQIPHAHESFPMDNFPDGTLSEALNYCRNPDLRQGIGPWCYTTDPDVEWETCDVPICTTSRPDPSQSDCIQNEIGSEYQGTWMNTVTGKTCQKWNSQTPHQHNFTDPSLFPDKTLNAADKYCRNPDRRRGVGPWCYTTDSSVEWESCGLPLCMDNCKIRPCTAPECRLTDIGDEYTGKKSVTASGYRCQRWDVQAPNAHPYTDPELFPDKTLAEASNYCRNPDKSPDTGPWCYTTDKTVQWESCGIIYCSECKATRSGRDYVGHQSMTTSGRICQSWAYQFPHAHTFTEDDMFPDLSVKSASNYCRNPDGRPEGPWCYTLDPTVEWEPCGIADCQGPERRECLSSYHGDDYLGHKSITVSGRSCQHWKSQQPHEHNFTSVDFPDSSLNEAANYCRNPDRRQGYGPWCYTLDPDVTWEFCGIPYCHETEILNTKEGLEYMGVRSVTSSGIPCQEWNKYTPHSHKLFDRLAFPEHSLSKASNYCRNPDRRPSGPWCYTVDPNVESETCGIATSKECRVTESGYEYTGHQSMTVSRRVCQRWHSQVPHAHNYTEDSMFPDYTVQDAANYCRNPNNSESVPWCYTTDPDVVMEPCFIPKCDDCKMSTSGRDYNGSRSFTISGRICQRWDEQVPNHHTFTDGNFPDLNISDANNYCRNPDDTPDGPWCFTIDPEVKRESCGIKLCMNPGCRQTVIGRAYQGEHFFTVSGRLCQRWDKQLPHNHSFTDPTFFPDRSLSDASNYCRNPDDDPGGPWCYTTDPDQIRETCNIPMCSECISKPSGVNYAGTRSITGSGRVCQRWDVQSPHSHNTNIDDLPDSSLTEAANYCRNPDGRTTGPWCYTLDPDIETETCGLSQCNAENAEVPAEPAPPTSETSISEKVDSNSNGTRELNNTDTWIPRRCDYYLQRSLTRYNQTIDKVVSKLLRYIASVDNYTVKFVDEPSYVINATIMRPILVNFGEVCNWCLDNEQTKSALQLAKQLIEQWQNSVVERVTVDVLKDIKQAAGNYFRKDWVQGLIAPIVSDDVRHLQTSLRKSAKTVTEALSKTDSTIMDMKDSSRLTNEIAKYVWNVECNSQLLKFASEYEHFKKTIADVLDQFERFLDKARKTYQRYINDYISGSMPLEEISKSLAFKDLQMQMQAAKIKINTYMTTGQFMIQTIYSQTNQLYYTMLAYTDPEWIASTSAYWQYINISSPGITLPTMRTIDGVLLFDDDYGIVPEESVILKWKRPVDNIANIRKELESRIRSLDRVINDAKGYLEGYLKGNQIDEEFFARNFINVEIFCPDMSARSVVENKVYDYPNLLSDVGGVMGLLLGASVISIGELLDLIIRSFVYRCRNK